MPHGKAGRPQPVGYSEIRTFTMGQIADICDVAPRTVAKWFDTGRLKGYRIPGSQDRRVPRERLVEFLVEHKMPLGEFEAAGDTGKEEVKS